MRWSWKTEWAPLLVLAAMFVASALLWSSTPERVPIHWNFAGEVDGWGGRFSGLLLMPLLCVGIYLLFFVLPLLDPGRANYAGFRTTLLVLRVAILVFMGVVHGVVVASGRGVELSMTAVMAPLSGALFLVIGLVLGKVRPNWFVGVRTPWTLSSKKSWTATHRLGGWIFVALGIAIIAVGFAWPGAALVITTVGGLLGALAICVYSYFVWRNDTERIPPAGTTPADEA